MKSILTISGSYRPESSNLALLAAITQAFPAINFIQGDIIRKLPLFEAQLDTSQVPDVVKQWRKQVADADAVLIVTPEYIFNFPAILKNAFEWLTSSGELDSKAVLPISYTPHSPRGEKAMQSMIWSLTALNARIVTQLSLYKNTITIIGTELEESEDAEMLKEAIKLL